MPSFASAQPAAFDASATAAGESAAAHPLVPSAEASPASTLTPGLLRTLAMLRWLAAAGQLATIVLVVTVLHVPLPLLPLCGGVAVLAAFNLWASWRARHAARVGPGEVVAHLAVDIGVLAWLIGWSGGATNPFSPLFLLPIALAAVSLPTRWAVATMLLSGIGYTASALLGMPWPHQHDHGPDAFHLHLAGMAVMFVLSAGVITFFLTRLAQALHERELELARLREQFARNEGIVALATHAAAVAHELNTPLGTLTLMVEDELSDAPAGKEESLRTMAALVDVCRDRVRELAAPAGQATSGDTASGTSLDRTIERWQLLRPSITLARSGNVAPEAIRHLDPGIAHLLTALLNNAADASEQAGDSRVALHLNLADGMLLGSVRDHGNGFGEAASWPGALFRSSKPDGLGVGLALSHATVERLGGELTLQPAAGGGSLVSFRLPLPAGMEDR